MWILRISPETPGSGSFLASVIRSSLSKRPAAVAPGVGHLLFRSVCVALAGSCGASGGLGTVGPRNCRLSAEVELEQIGRLSEAPVDLVTTC